MPPARAAQDRSHDKRERILALAMRHFAERGYEAARVEDLARELGIAKGSVFQHFGTKEGLFLAAYRRAVEALPRYQDAPAAVRARGFFATLRYWLERTEHLLREDLVSYRLTLIGNYGSDLALRREINRYLAGEDAYGTVAFVQEGLARGELRRDVEAELVSSMLEWSMERFQDALLAEELFPGFFRRRPRDPARLKRRIDEFLKVLEAAIGSGSSARSRRRSPRRRTPRR
ncbi:MAG TPA: helix-turn-helix domain-containing protein [Vicinamibacteria bacterium]|nr:helix-turn-helix domain-containing protein [Vicinamibacteria bacterium]